MLMHDTYVPTGFVVNVNGDEYNFRRFIVFYYFWSTTDYYFYIFSSFLLFSHPHLIIYCTILELNQENNCCRNVQVTKQISDALHD